MAYLEAFSTFFQNYLQNRYQRVVLNGTVSDWRSMNAGVPQGSVLGHDLTGNISSEMRLFADDSSLFTRVEEVNETHENRLGLPVENGL